jgi:hypothetical protein
VSVVEKKNSLATGKSTQAFQVADSAIEMVLKKAVIDPSKNLDVLATSLGTTCSNGVIKANISGGMVDITFGDEAGVGIDDCTKTLSDVADVKATGQYGSTTRAISTAVAAGTLKWENPTSYLNGWDTDSSNPVKCALDSRTNLVYLKGQVINSAGYNPDVDTAVTFMNLPDSCKPSIDTFFYRNGENSATDEYWVVSVIIKADNRVRFSVNNNYTDHKISNINLEGMIFSK